LDKQHVVLTRLRGSRKIIFNKNNGLDGLERGNISWILGRGRFRVLHVEGVCEFYERRPQN
jgi:hypothetical protein